MPAIAALVINDGAATPVAHTFSPVTTSGSKAEWADRSSTTPAGNRKLNHEVLPPAGQRTTNKISIGVYNPTEALVDGVTIVVHGCSVGLTLNFPPESTVQERTDTLAYISNMLANATVKTSIINIEPFW